MPTHAYLGLTKDASPASFGTAVTAAIGRAGEAPPHVSGELIDCGWLVKFHSSAKDAKSGSKPSRVWRVTSSGGINKCIEEK